MDSELENIRKAVALIEDARNSFWRGDGLLKRYDWSGAIEAYQHCIELEVKSLYRVQGMDYPWDHDPTKDFEKAYLGLIDRTRDIPELSAGIEMSKRELARARWISIVSSKLHELSMYPFCDVAAKDYFKKEDVEYLQNIAGDVRRIAELFVSRIDLKAKKII